MAELTRDEVIDSLRIFKSRRDALLHEDASTFDHHLQRFIDFCQSDDFVQSILGPVCRTTSPDVEAWRQQLDESGNHGRGSTNLGFPADPDKELALQFAIIEAMANQQFQVWGFGRAIGVYKLKEAVEQFKILVVRPLAEELSHRLGDAANIASPEIRALQAVLPNRIPGDSETRIFLSHKTVDKPMVRLYHQVLTELGFRPWLDESDMPAGSSLERSLLQGFEESCAAVFFITENFVDEKYLATEVEYAVIQKRKKGKKFAIITLRYSDAAPIPGLLEPFIYKTVNNHLEGLYELVRALPIELGPMRWKAEVVAN